MRYLNIPSGILKSFCVPRSLFPARRVFLDLEWKEESKTGAILDICEDKAQMAAFEDWSAMSHDDHMFTITMIQTKPWKVYRDRLPGRGNRRRKKVGIYVRSGACKRGRVGPE